MLDYARKLARVPKELLGLEKLAINKTQDIQGFREAIAVGFEIDVIGHLSEAVVDVNRRIREDGLRPTIEAWQAGEFQARSAFGRARWERAPLEPLAGRAQRAVSDRRGQLPPASASGAGGGSRLASSSVPSGRPSGNSATKPSFTNSGASRM